MLLGAGMLAVRLLAAITFVARPPAAFAASHQTPYLIDDFEGPAALRSWHTDKSPGSPATSGTLALGSGHRGHGAVFSYRIACETNRDCDADAAAALWRPASPLPKRRNPALCLWIRFQPEVRISLVAKDTSGQTVRFEILPTLENPKAGDWQYVAVPLASKSAAVTDNHAIGRLEKPLLEIGIVVHARGHGTVQGVVDFDDILLQENSEVVHIDPAAQVGPSSLVPSKPAPIGSEHPPTPGQPFARPGARSRL